jgi:uncharacterized membrane protein
MSAHGQAAHLDKEAREKMPTHAASNHQSRVWLYIAAATLALVGLIDALYLTVMHLTGQSVQCSVTVGCNEVLGSAYATIAGIPLAMLGAIAYFTVFSLAMLAAFRYRNARNLLALTVLLMLLTTLWLLFVQAFVIKHFCQYCLLSAAVTLTLSIITGTERFINRRA